MSGISGFPTRLPTFWTWAADSVAAATDIVSAAVSGKKPIVGYVILSANAAAGVSVDVVELKTGTTSHLKLVLPGADDGNIGVVPVVVDLSQCPIVGAIDENINLATSNATSVLYWSVAYIFA